MPIFPEGSNIWVIDESDYPAGQKVPYRQWKEAVLPVLAKMASTKAGKALLLSVQTTARYVQVQPLRDPSKCNAQGTGFLDYPGYDEAFRKTGRRPLGPLYFDPLVYKSGSECYKSNGGANPRWNRGSYPDEVCFHEMIHTYRQGLYRRIDTPRPDATDGGLILYGDIEEFFAIVLTNIYISDDTNHTKSGLRADHYHHRPLESELSGSITFYQSGTQVFGYINRLATENYILCKLLGAVKASFNPLAAYFRDFKRVKSMSQSSLAVGRDQTIPTLPKPGGPPQPTTLVEALTGEALGVLRGLQKAANALQGK